VGCDTVSLGDILKGLSALIFMQSKKSGGASSWTWTV
jgi:hypothetical protein